LRILLTNALPAEQSPSAVGEKLQPIGLLLLASKLRSAGHKVFFHDTYTIRKDMVSQNFIEKNKINVIGIYVTTICIEDVLRQLKIIREDYGFTGKIILGGPHFSIMTDNDKLLQYADTVVIGEADNKINSIVKSNLRLIKCNLIHRNAMDDLPLPAYDLTESLYFKGLYRSHYAQMPVISMNTSRGCPHKCVFCSSLPVSSRIYRFQSGERVFNDLEYLLEKYEPNTIYFRENNFCVSKKRVVELCELILKHNLKVKWNAEASTKDLYDKPDMIKLMKQAGLQMLFIGFETGSENLLKRIKPGFTMEMNIKAAELCNKLGVKMLASYMVGFPYETERDIKLTHEFKDKHTEKSGNFNNINVYVGLPGSKLYDQLDRNGLYAYKDPRWGIIYTEKHNEYIKRFYKNPGYKFEVPKNE